MPSNPQSNRLAQQTSPYLLQHASNPVHWLPWGEAAWQEAQQRDCPVLISVGYAACHWCHVMERESFVDADIAKVLNENFVSIKVDREERPDVDAVYMAAVQAMNEGRGGWPMTVLAAPNKQPFFAATYLPPRDGPRGTGFLTVLKRVVALWREERPQLLSQAEQVTSFVRQGQRAPQPLQGALGGNSSREEGSSWWREPVRRAAAQAGRDFDPQHGGFGAPPKFLATPTLRLLLRLGWLDGAAACRDMVIETLLGMTRGGLWDWVGGGFSRYSTDAAWRVPHFEKMLYDNALMATTLLEAHQASNDGAWGGYARATLDFVAAEMRHPQGGFYTAIDADSEHVEGKFYTWPHAEAHEMLLAALGEQEATAWLAALGATREGNWEDGRNILYAAEGHGAHSAKPICRGAQASWQQVRGLLMAARNKRSRPQTDDKILLGQNGLMITAFATAARVFASSRDLAIGCAAADFAWSQFRRPSGGLYRTWRAGHAHVLGALEDYAYFGEGLVALYEAGAPRLYLEQAAEVMAWLCEAFVDPQSGALFDNDQLEEPLLFRPVRGHDDAQPSANAVAASTLARLHAHTGNPRFAHVARGLYAAWQRPAEQSPTSFITLLQAAADAARPSTQIVWLGQRAPQLSPLWSRAQRPFIPQAVYAHGSGAAEDASWPLLAGKTAREHDVVFVCQQETCLPAIADEGELASLLTKR